MGTFGKKLAGMVKNLTGTTGKSPPAAPPLSTNEQKRAQIRIKLLPLHQVSLLVEEFPAANPVEVSNISLNGVGLIWKSDWPSDQTKLTGVLKVAEESISILLRVVHYSHGLLGCEIIQSQPLIADVVHRFLRNEAEAQKMIEVNPEYLQEVDEGTPHFFTGKNNCELYYIESGKKVIHFHLSFFGSYLEGGPNEPVKYGVIEEDGISEKASYQGSAMVKSSNAKVTKDTQTSAIKFVENIHRAETDVRKQICAMLSG